MKSTENKIPEPKKWGEEFLTKFQPSPEKDYIYPIDYQCVLDDQIDFIENLLLSTIESCIPEGLDEKDTLTNLAAGYVKGFNSAIAEMRSNLKKVI